MQLDPKNLCIKIIFLKLVSVIAPNCTYASNVPALCVLWSSEHQTNQLAVTKGSLYPGLIPLLS